MQWQNVQHFNRELTSQSHIWEHLPFCHVLNNIPGSSGFKLTRNDKIQGLYSQGCDVLLQESIKSTARIL